MPILGSFGAGAAKGFGLTMAGKKIEGISFLVLAGGAGGGTNQGGGGGAGGYRLVDPANSGQYSGGPDNSSSQDPAGTLDLFLGKDYSLVVGAGGTTGQNPTPPTGYSNNGSPSVFATITSLGGGGGAFHPPTIRDANPLIPNSFPEGRGWPGGSGGGNGVGSGENGDDQNPPSSKTADPSKRGPGTPGQGYPGGLGGYTDKNPFPGGGGGGAGASGTDATPGPPPGASPQPGNGGPGGNGLTSSITGSPVTRGGGGGGGSREDQGPGGSGGPGGGGSWRNGQAGTSGGTNQGAGGGSSTGANTGQYPGGNGGSGVVVIKIPASFTATFSPGVTQTSSTNPTHKIYTVTATSDSSQTVQFNEA